MHRVLPLALFVLASALLVAPAAHAGFAFTAPVQGATLSAGDAVDIAWEASCAPDRACASWEAYNVFGKVILELARDGGTDWNDRGYMQVPLPTAAAKMTLDDSAGAGRWTLRTTWADCPRTANPHDRLDPTACIQESHERALLVRPHVGTKHRQPAVNTYQVRGTAGTVKSDLYFQCNAPGPRYRADFRVQARMRVGRRMVWKTLVSKAGVRAITDPESRTRCIVKRTFALPRSVTRTTMVRTQFAMRTVGITPAAKPRTVTSRPFTRTSLAGGGGITIGS